MRIRASFYSANLPHQIDDLFVSGEIRPFRILTAPIVREIRREWAVGRDLMIFPSKIEVWSHWIRHI